MYAGMRVQMNTVSAEGRAVFSSAPKCFNTAFTAVTQTSGPLRGVAQKRGLQVNFKGGRSSVSGVVATVFGSTGHIGKYVVNRLGSVGSQVIIPYRGEESSYKHMKPMGDLGQIVPIWWDCRNRDTIERAIEHSNVVVNMVGARWETKNFGFEEVNVDVARTIAEVAEAAGVERLIHFSALGAKMDSSSSFARTKYFGEEAVKEAFPKATILRPAQVFGPFDYLLNNMAQVCRFYPLYPLTDPDSKLQPVYSVDVARAVMNAIADNKTQGKTYELGGPDIFTRRELVRKVHDVVRWGKPVVELPRWVVQVYFRYLEKVMRTPKMTCDEIEWWSQDLVVSEDALTLEDLLVDELSTVEDLAIPTYVRLWRKAAFLNEVEEN